MVYKGSVVFERNSKGVHMSRDSNFMSVSYPQIYLLRMVLFLFLAIVFVLIIYPQIAFAFQANVGLNGFIIVLLILGIVYVFRQVIMLFREIRWVKYFQYDNEAMHKVKPQLLAPIASIFANHDKKITSMSPQAMRSLLDTISARLDEEREIGRYLIALLVFMGLLGTFWGLLDTIRSISYVFNALDVSVAESTLIFDQLKTGLEEPMRGMGTAFSSSLFGLASSLTLGFLELQASQAQNNFYTELENLFSSVTDVDNETGHTNNLPPSIYHTLNEMNKTLSELNQCLKGK